MRRWFFETHNELNWGKFMVCEFERTDFAVRSQVDTNFGQSLIGGRGWSREHLLIVDLQTGEGAMFKPGGSARADLEKHKIWVCPMFPLFLGWLYEQNYANLHTLPSVIELPGPMALRGYRRAGPQKA